MAVVKVGVKKFRREGGKNRPRTNLKCSRGLLSHRPHTPEHHGCGGWAQSRLLCHKAAQRRGEAQVARGAEGEAHLLKAGVGHLLAGKHALPQLLPHGGQQKRFPHQWLRVQSRRCTRGCLWSRRRATTPVTPTSSSSSSTASEDVGCLCAT